MEAQRIAQRMAPEVRGPYRSMYVVCSRLSDASHARRICASVKSHLGSVPSDLPASVRSRASGHFAPSPPARGPATLVAMKTEARSAEFGNIFESALLCKALAKRQCSGIHFEQVTVITAEAVADATRRVYEVAFSDWKPKLKLNTRGVPTSDEEITTRAAAIGDEAWFERNASTYETHPSMPRALASPLRRLLKREREGEEAEDESPAPHAPAVSRRALNYESACGTPCDRRLSSSDRGAGRS